MPCTRFCVVTCCHGEDPAPQMKIYKYNGFRIKMVDLSQNCTHSANFEKLLKHCGIDYETRGDGDLRIKIENNTGYDGEYTLIGIKEAHLIRKNSTLTIPTCVYTTCYDNGTLRVDSSIPFKTGEELLKILETLGVKFQRPGSLLKSRYLPEVDIKQYNRNTLMQLTDLETKIDRFSGLFQ